MDWETVVAMSAAIVAIGGHVVNWWRGRGEHSTTVRRDTVSDRDALIDQLQEELAGLRRRVDLIESDLRIERAWNRDLVDHIYRGLPPPPPPKPAAA